MVNRQIILEIVARNTYRSDEELRNHIQRTNRTYNIVLTVEEVLEEKKRLQEAK